MTVPDDNTKYVCHNCIGDPILASEVKERGAIKECNYCCEMTEALSLDDLADRIHDVVQEHFEPVFDQDYWFSEGTPVTDVIARIAHLDEWNIAEDLMDLLSYLYRDDAIRDGGEDPYDIEAYYEEISPNDGSYRYDWSAFRNEIMYQERFFPENAEPVLQEHFGDISSLKAYDGTPVVREVAPEDKDFSIWRARTAHSKEELSDILKSPTSELGPPPSSSVKAGGRMNAPGISVFYGAMDQSTCVSEVRPPVGSFVVLGRFELLRSVKLLDLGEIAEAYDKSSHFDPNYSDRKNRGAFLRRLVDEISQPVMPQDESREYLPTQFVASYLAHKVHPQLDGIIFPSSQTEGKGRNLVLFNRSRGVKPYDLPPGTDVDVSLPRHSQEDKHEYGNIWVTETVPSNPPVESQAEPDQIKSGPIRLFMEDEPEVPESYSDPTLGLDVESIEVLSIEGVGYTSSSRSVTRHRQTEEERNDLIRRINRFVVDASSDSN